MLLFSGTSFFEDQQYFILQECQSEQEIESQTSQHSESTAVAFYSIPHKPENYRHAFWSAIGTLGLGCLGSSILPMPLAFVKSGVLPGFFLMGVVAWANDFTATLLLKSAAATQTDSYESCAYCLGGRPWKVGGYFGVELCFLIFRTGQSKRNWKSKRADRRSTAFVSLQF
uniref:Amino acid transporter transmembrane domain-containing protein n=1 Tax=Tetraselmis sp. GSL018 TaxID=582737 RepID=A0A061SAZ4_9CHLO